MQTVVVAELREGLVGCVVSLDSGTTSLDT